MQLIRRAKEKLTDQFNFTRDFLFVTLDSLRYDTADECLAEGLTPNFGNLIGRWECRETCATFTLPAHIGMFSGMMPRPLQGDNISLSTEARMFALSTSWDRYKGRNIRFFFDNAENVPRGFASKGYHTIGVGGVGWFSTEVKSSSFWEGQYFQRFLYKASYNPVNPRAFEEQLEDLGSVLSSLNDKHRFVFINVSSTHHPYSNGDGTRSLAAQKACLAYVDRHLPKLVSFFAKGTLGVVCGDHGDCLGEDGLWGHNMVHEKVMTVPYAEFEV